MSNHTPAPWYVAQSANIHDQGLVISEATSENVCVTYNGEPDARLIAAAPELLEAAKVALFQFDLIAEHVELGTGDIEALGMLREAIAKAVG